MILFLDTSGQEAVINLLSEDYDVVATANIQTKSDLSDKLLLEIERLLTKLGLDKKDLSEIFVAKGPGSYTGLRIGLSTVNLLAYSLDIPISGIENKNEMSIEELLGLLKTKKTSSGKSKNFDGAVTPFYKFPPHITVKK
jgi:tRNA threonylcarbamoyladenosine biosynthesis protein TsaB